MKWVKVAIGAVIAILSVGIIATSVYNMTQEQLEIRTDLITGDVTTVGEGSFGISTNFYNGIGTITSTVLNEKINNDLIYLEFIGVNGSFSVKVTNNRLAVGSGYYMNIMYNGIEYIDYIFFTYTGDTVVFDRNTTTGKDFSEVFGFEYEVGDTLTLYEQEQPAIPAQLTGISATLILLAPLIFAGGVLAYLLNKQNY